MAKATSPKQQRQEKKKRRTVREEQALLKKQDAEAVLISVSATFHTNNDDKDDDTELTISLTKGNQLFATTPQPILGLFDDGTNNGPFYLLVTPGVKKADIPNAITTVHIEPNGNDTWRFDYKLVLGFSDQSNSEYLWRFLVVDQDNKDLVKQL
jgi:hypothetical protein